ncbi:MAG: hypothetical protein JNL88_01250 [Bacteroidia bacterium]|nr:hypothetical protein [Bacteroidia bacterium]
MQLDGRNKFIIAFIVLGALSRLIPHPLNFTPVAAMALFGGTYLLNKRMAFLVPVSVMFLSDTVLELVNGSGFHPEMIWVYGSMLLITGLGFFLRGREQRQTIMVASLSGSLLFFFITNFGTWTTGLYGYTAQGLGQCYIAAIPFFKGTVMGDLFYNLVFFGGFALVNRFAPQLVKKKV